MNGTRSVCRRCRSAKELRRGMRSGIAVVRGVARTSRWLVIVGAMTWSSGIVAILRCYSYGHNGHPLSAEGNYRHSCSGPCSDTRRITREVQSMNKSKEKIKIVNFIEQLVILIERFFRYEELSCLSQPSRGGGLRGSAGCRAAPGARRTALSAP
jgi:hypothetical protein